MAKKKIKKGTILINPWAGDKNPTRKFIYIGNYKTLGIYNGKIDIVNWNKCDVFKDFIEVGKSDLFEVLEKELKLLEQETIENIGFDFNVAK